MEKGRRPYVYDWRTYELWTEPKNQGYCAASWAFSAVGVLEGYWTKNRLGIPKMTFSEQQLIDCDNKNSNRGCNKGMARIVWVFLKDTSGLTSDKFLPYIAVTNPLCKARD